MRPRPAPVSRRPAREKHRDHGFTLVELLVVVVIIGVLVAIAIPVYLHYKDGAENKSLKSDMRAAVAAEEQCLADQETGAGPGYVAGASTTYGVGFDLICVPGALPIAEPVKVSAGNKLTIAVVAAAGSTPQHFVITGQNRETGKTYSYDSSTNRWS